MKDYGIYSSKLGVIVFEKPQESLKFLISPQDSGSSNS